MKKSTRLISLLLATLMAVGIMSGCGKTATGEETPKEPDPAATPVRDDIVIATASETPSLSATAHNSLAGNVMNALTYSTLFAIDENMQPQKSLVDSYENTSDTVWVFKLKVGVKFHDGTELKAADVKASIEAAKQSTVVVNFTKSIESIEATGDYEITITTPTPSATLLFDLSNHGNSILPKTLIDNGNDFNKTPIGSGPYKFVSWTSGEQLVFEAFADYFEGAPAIKNMTWKIIPEGSARTIALEAGEVDLVTDVEAMDVERLEKDEDITLLRKASNIVSWFQVNTEKPGLDNVDVRRAINCAINKEDVITVAANSLGTPALAQMPTGMGGESLENTDTYDVAKAKEYLAKSGVAPESIVMSIIASNDSKKRAAEVIQANLKEIGINCEVETMDVATYASAVAEGNFTAAIGGYSSTDMVSALRGVYHSSSIGSSNMSRTNNAEIDALIEKASTTVDAAERETILKECNTKLNELCPQIPLYQGEQLRAFNSKLEGVSVNGAATTKFEKISWAK